MDPLDLLVDNAPTKSGPPSGASMDDKQDSQTVPVVADTDTTEKNVIDVVEIISQNRLFNHLHAPYNHC